VSLAVLVPFIYFIQMGEDGPVKIGTGVDPVQRMYNLQPGNPRALRLRYIVPGDYAVETALHRRFTDFRLLGEWCRGTRRTRRSGQLARSPASSERQPMPSEPKAGPPARLIDPDGEGAYFLSDDESWSLRSVAFEFFGDGRRWDDLESEAVWMREGEDGNWHRDRWRGRYVLLPESRCPVVGYSYITPKPDAAPWGYTLKPQPVWEGNPS
jgi:hypothetical protein